MAKIGFKWFPLQSSQDPVKRILYYIKKRETGESIIQPTIPQFSNPIVDKVYSEQEKDLPVLVAQNGGLGSHTDNIFGPTNGINVNFFIKNRNIVGLVELKLNGVTLQEGSHYTMNRSRGGFVMNVPPVTDTDLLIVLNTTNIPYNWQIDGTSGIVPTRFADEFTGNIDGSNTTFSPSRTPRWETMIIVLDNKALMQGTDKDWYELNGDVEFNIAPSIGLIMQMRYIATDNDWIEEDSDGTLVGLINGSNRVYTIRYAMDLKSAVVELDGEEQFNDESGGLGTFTILNEYNIVLGVAPSSGRVAVRYRKSTYGEKRATNVSSVTITSAATLTVYDEFVELDSTGGAFNLTLSASTIGKKYTLKKIDLSSNDITIIGTIDGDAGVKLTQQYETISIVGNGTDYNEVSGAVSSPHTVASHEDTTSTGEQLDSLFDGSDADDKHVHNQCNVRMYATSNTTLTTINTWYKIDFDATTHILNGTFSAANSRFTVDESGTYGIKVALYINIGNNVYVDVGVRINGAIGNVDGARIYGSSTYMSIPINDDWNLESGDYVEVWARSNSASRTVLATQFSTYCNVKLSAVNEPAP